MNIKLFPNTLSGMATSGSAQHPGTRSVDPKLSSPPSVPADTAPSTDLYSNPKLDADNYRTTIYGTPNGDRPRVDPNILVREQRLDGFADRVKTQLADIETGSEGERNIKFQRARLFTEPAGYFSAGLMAVGYDPHEKIEVTFYHETRGIGSSGGHTESEKRSYFAWEIAAGALAHDRTPAGGPINFYGLKIEKKDQKKVKDLESLGKKLQNRWEDEISPAMRDPVGILAQRSGKADAYVTRGTLQSLINDKDAFQTLSPEAQRAIKHTLEKNGQIIIPDLYGYPLSGYAFVPYTPYDGNPENRPNQGVMIDLKNGAIREIRGDKDFADWAKNNRNNLQRSFNARDLQGGKDAHWPKAADVIDNFISGNHTHYPGYSSFFKDKAVPVWETFNYTQSRNGDYRLKYGNLDSEIAGKFQEVNANNAVWSDQTEVFGSSQQSWKAAKDVWGSTFGYVPIVGNAGNIVFGVHDSLYGKTAEDRLGGSSAAVISGLQLAHEIIPLGAEAAFGEAPATSTSSAFSNYKWRPNKTTKEIEFAEVPKPPSSRDIPAPLIPKETDVTRLRPSQAGNISQHAIANGEQLIENATRNSKGIYQVKNGTADRWFIRYTDATGKPAVYEIKGNFKLNNDYVQIIDPAKGKPVMIVHSDGKGGWSRVAADGGIKWPWRRPVSPTPSDEIKTPATFAGEFLEIDGRKMVGAEKLDDILKIKEGTQFELSSRNFEEEGVIKRRFNVSWNLEEPDFTVTPGESAQITEYSSSEYSPNFIVDLNRNPYTVTTVENGVPTTTRLNAVAGTAENNIQARLAQFEAAVPDANMRERISEVAHQGATAPATIELHGGTTLQEDYYFAADNTEFQIEYNASKGTAKVHVTSKGHLSNPHQEVNPIPGVQVTIKRTFTIREGNGLDSLYDIGKQAPTTIEVSVVTTP